ncbi:MAG: Asp-tRNA(Asn)/Glu-tRNA(Gln) amidotransferase subunit GatA, partial [Tissierella sp.]|nr:Asp-tRNA(Asn)/Glu-tRNA(Gln) amidotransferase subunit GatA [Tissierella sp.]
MSLIDKSISQLIQLMELNEVSSEEIVKECIANIEKETADSSIYKLILKDEAISKAREIDRKRKNKESLGPLAGIPLIITDDISTKGVLTSAGSRILENYIPIFDATVVERISAEDTIILGKVKVKEFGLTPTQTVSKTLDRKGAIWGLSTSQDSRKFSMKPTFGMISRYGVIGARSTFDQIVPITNSVEDMAAVLNSIVEYDQKDSTSIDMDKVDYTKALNTNIE